jgi:hypothetical protein
MDSPVSGDPACFGGVTLEDLSSRWPKSLRRRFASAMLHRTRKRWPYSPWGPDHDFGIRFKYMELARVYELRVLPHFRCRLGGSTRRKSLYPSSLGTVYRPFGRSRFSGSAVRGFLDATPVCSMGWRCATVSRLHRKCGRTFKSWTKFVSRFVRNSSASVHDLTHITVAFKTRKIIENTRGPVRDLRAARQRPSRPLAVPDSGKPTCCT